VLNEPWFWSAETFGRFALDHGRQVKKDVQFFNCLFPVAKILDTFSAEQGPPPGPLWHTPYAMAALVSKDGHCRPGNIDDYNGMAAFNTLLGPSCEIFFTLAEFNADLTIAIPGNWDVPLFRTWINNEQDDALNAPSGINLSLIWKPDSFSHPPQPGFYLSYETYGFTPRHVTYGPFTPHIGDRFGIRCSGACSVYYSPVGQPWQRVLNNLGYSVQNQPAYTVLWIDRLFILSNTSRWIHACALDNFGATQLPDDPLPDNPEELQDNWNNVAHAMGIPDLDTTNADPVAPFATGDAGEMLFTVCCLLAQLPSDTNLPPPLTSDPIDWRTYLETGTYPGL